MTSDSAQCRECSTAIDLLAAWHDGYINGLSPDDFQRLLTKTSRFLENETYDTDCDPGDESPQSGESRGGYGHGV